jgi:quinohemoprotein ethanol dehydrogenase
LTFALGGHEHLPPSAPPDFIVHAVDNPTLELNDKDIAAGRALSVQCAFCHGVGLQSTGTPGPDLRESAIALDLTRLTDLLKSGVLIQQGMPRFEYLTDEQIRQIYIYIRAKSREALRNAAER